MRTTYLVALAAIHGVTFVATWRAIRRACTVQWTRGLEWTGPAR